MPTELGTALVETYQKMDIHLYKPNIRAEMEKELKDVAEGLKSKDEVLKNSIESMQEIYQ